MNIDRNPVWENISPFKKPVHLLRFAIAQKYASLYPRANFIGITGSVGKTTTAKACLAVLSQKFKTIVTKESLTSIFNIPITLLETRPKIKKVILEMGVEYPGEMEFYLSLIKPSTAIITRIYFAHSEFLGNIEQIIKEKSLLVKQLPKDGYAILNYDDIYTRRLAKETESQVIFYGTDPDNCLVWADNIKIEGSGTKFELNCGVERVEINLKLLGRHMIYPSLAAAALGISCNLSLLNIKKGLEQLEPAVHRLQLLEGLNGFSVLDDTYNSSPAALEEALNVLNEVPAKKRIAVLGEMRELGVYSEKLHKEIAQKIYKDNMINMVLLGGGDAVFIADELNNLGFIGRVEAKLSNSQMVSEILKIAGNGDLILVKASHDVRLDEVVKRITKQK